MHRSSPPPRVASSMSKRSHLGAPAHHGASQLVSGHSRRAIAGPQRQVVRSRKSFVRASHFLARRMTRERIGACAFLRSPRKCGAARTLPESFRPRLKQAEKCRNRTAARKLCDLRETTGKWPLRHRVVSGWRGRFRQIVLRGCETSGFGDVRRCMPTFGAMCDGRHFIRRRRTSDSAKRTSRSRARALHRIPHHADRNRGDADRRSAERGAAAGRRQCLYRDPRCPGLRLDGVFRRRAVAVLRGVSGPEGAAHGGLRDRAAHHRPVWRRRLCAVARGDRNRRRSILPARSCGCAWSKGMSTRSCGRRNC